MHHACMHRHVPEQPVQHVIMEKACITQEISYCSELDFEHKHMGTNICVTAVFTYRQQCSSCSHCTCPVARHLEGTWCALYTLEDLKCQFE